MKSWYIPLALAIAGNIIYHLAQKNIRKDADPLVAILIAYAIGFVACLALFPFVSHNKPLLTSLRDATWANAALGLSVAMVEVGFLLVYRSGIPLGLAPVVSNVAVTLVLLPIGLFIFQEHLSLPKVAGVLLCVLGISLISSGDYLFSQTPTSTETPTESNESSGRDPEVETKVS